jgi:hypothetical protein
MLVAVLNSGIVFTVPPVVVTFDDAAGAPEAGVELVAGLAPTLAPLFGGVASMKAEGGSPPMVSASTAFRA